MVSLILMGLMASFSHGEERDWTKDMFPVQYTLEDVIRIPEAEGCKFILCPVNGFTVYSHDCTDVPEYPEGLESESLSILGTGIKTLSVVSFSTWRDIVSLRIDMNSELETIEPKAFFYLSSLTNLSISNNYKLSTLDPNVFDGLTNLKVLQFVKNNVKSLYEITLATRPFYLPSLLHLDLSNNPIQSITKMDFAGLEYAPLESLTMKMCGISSIEPDSFSGLTNLKSLTLDGNKLLPDTLSLLISPFNNTLPNLYHLGIASNILHRNFKNLLRMISYSNITSLDLSDNHFDSLPAEFFPLMPNIERLDLSGIFADDVEEGTFSKAVLPKLKRLEFARNRLIGFVEGMRVPQLLELNLSENSCTDCTVTSLFQIDNYDLRNMKNLEVLELSGNNMYQIYTNMFYGLKSLKGLYLSNCTLFSIEDNSFSHLRKLEHLDLSRNSLKSDKLNALTFKGLNSLTSLRLDSCSIMSFPNSDIFLYLTSLKFLTLRENKITQIDPKLFMPLLSLKRIDLSDNDILPWSVQIFSKNTDLEYLSLASNHIYKLTPEMARDLEKVNFINMRYNPIKCNCELVYNVLEEGKSRNYFGLNDSAVVCISPREWTDVQVMEFVNLNTIRYSCFDWRLYAMIAGLCALFTLVICSVGIYFLRWYLRYWLFLFKQAWRATCPVKKDAAADDKYKYDAFVSYSVEDRNFVIRMVAMLENYEPYFRMCIFERDFNAGDVISESVVDCLAVSRKTILILTDSFARSQWCQWEMQMAQHKRFFFKSDSEDSLILIKLGDIMDAHMTPTLRYLMKTRIYLQWFPDPKRQRIFWQKLREALKHVPKGEVQV